MEHVFENDPSGSTETDVLWRCAKCGVPVGFNRKGVGEPWASETELPDNASDYVGPCEAIDPDEEVVLKLSDLRAMQGKAVDQAAVDELIQKGAPAAINEAGVKVAKR